MKNTFLTILAVLLFAHSSHSDTISLPPQWSNLTKILELRLHQLKPKMKLYPKDIESLKNFMGQLAAPTPHLIALQKLLPKTTLELLRSTENRGVPLKETEKMAAYLQKIVTGFEFKNSAAFDENTSHIIGREWREIDYSGEGMTWEGQRRQYIPYGIVNFKSLGCVEKFFAVESKLPYFTKVYRPQNPGYI